MTVGALFKRWVERYFSDEEAVILLVILVLGLVAVIWLGKMLAPFFISLVIAFLLQGVMNVLTRRGVPHVLAVWLVFLGFVGVLLALSFLLMPLIWNQLVGLVQEAPRMFAAGQRLIDGVQARYPHLLTPDQIQQWVGMAGREMTQVGQHVLTLSLASLGNIIALIVYLVLVPILVLFLLKDSGRLIDFLLSLLPRKRALLTRVWHEMEDLVANYVRGKFIEIIVVGSVSFLAFAYFGLPYAALLSVVVGLSVLVPYIGAVVAALPVAAVAGFHFGLSEQFIYVLVAYAVLQALDHHVLVPLLFSDAVNMHPVLVILAVLFFGGIWGVWGVLFAIPLATLLKALVQAWPRSRQRHRVETPSVLPGD